MVVSRKKIKDNGTQKPVQWQRMGILLCEQNFREVWRRNENVRAEFGQILHTHTRGSISSKDKGYLTRPNPVEKAYVAICSVNGHFLT